MSNIPLINPNDTTGHHHDDFNHIQLAFGTVPNMFKAIGQSAAALNSMWTSFTALGQGNLGAALGEQIAVLVADLNRCEYCLAAHTMLGQQAGLSAAQMAAAQKAQSSDPQTQAVLTFVRQMVTTKAHVSKTEVEQLQQAGFTAADVAEIIAHVALNIFTNYTNVSLAVPTDFPVIPFSHVA